MNILLYGLLWVSFGLLHSVLAAISVQQSLVNRVGSYYRLLYNIIAAIHLLLVMFAGSVLLDSVIHPVISSQNLQWLQTLIQLAGLVIILVALRQYDLMQFSGIAQVLGKESKVERFEALNTGGLNGWVRHPLYSGLLVYLWGGATSELGYFTAFFGSIYLLIGSRHEEKKLMTLYGNEYRIYTQNVPAFLPSLPR